MNEHAFELTAGVVFGLIALGHLIRVIFGIPFVVQNISIPMWASLVVFVIGAFLSYEGFHFARRLPPKS